MNRALNSIDRWGPATVSLLTLFLLAVFGWWYSAKVARLEGQISNQANQELALRTEIQTLQAYVNSLEKTIIRAGIETPKTTKRQKKEK